MNPYILIIVGALGLVGCLILLFMGLSMLREERAPKAAPAAGTAASRAGSSGDGAARDGPAEQAGRLAAGTPTAGGLVAGEHVPDVPAATMASAANPLAGLASRLVGTRTRGSAHEVMRVLRDNLTGRVLVEVAGTRYSNLGDIPDEAVRSALLTTLHDLDTFAGGRALEAAQPTAASVAVAFASQPAPAVEQPAAPSLAPEVRRPLPAVDLPAGAANEYRPLRPPTMNPFRQMAVLREMAKNPPPEPKSIAEQIDEVLQRRITGTPLTDRAIHMRPGPRGDAVFDVDGESYTGVDEVPDETVRDVIRAAIKEWEQTQ